MAGVSLVFWIGVIYFGRMIMYNGTLLYSMGQQPPPSRLVQKKAPPDSQGALFHYTVRNAG